MEDTTQLWKDSDNDGWVENYQQAKQALLNDILAFSVVRDVAGHNTAIKEMTAKLTSALVDESQAHRVIDTVLLCYSAIADLIDELTDENSEDGEATDAPEGTVGLETATRVV